MYILKVYSKTIHSDKKQILKNFLRTVPAHRSFTFNLRFLQKLKPKVRLSKTMCGISHFQFRFAFIKVCIFV